MISALCWLIAMLSLNWLIKFLLQILICKKNSSAIFEFKEKEGGDYYKYIVL